MKIAQKNGQPVGKWLFFLTVLDHHRTPLLVRLTEKLTAEEFGCFGGTCVVVVRALNGSPPYHAGCSGDLSAVIHAVIQQYTASRNIGPVSPREYHFLKCTTEVSRRVTRQRPCVGTTCYCQPPIDLIAGIESISNGRNRVYERHFTRMLLKHYKQWSRIRPDVYRPLHGPQPKTLEGFDNWFTAPAIGYSNAREYYAAASSSQFISSIQTPTTIITAQDDPFVPFEMFSSDRINYPKNVRLVSTNYGGHVGFVSKRGMIQTCDGSQRVVEHLPVKQFRS